MSHTKQRLSTRSENVFGYGFAVCFIVAGLYCLITLAAKPVFQSFEARNWQVAPITKISAHLDNRLNQPTVKATYNYMWEGQFYQANRVFFDESVGLRKAYYRHMTRQISRAGDVWVNPRDPKQSVIYRYVRWDKFLGNLFFSSIFLGFGYAFWAGLFFGRKQDKRETDRRKEHPNEPWKWPDEWQSTIYGNDQKSNMIVAIIAAIFINVWGLVILYGTLQGLRDGASLLSLLNLVVTLLGFAVAYGAYEAYKFGKRYGNMVFELQSLPSVLGQDLIGAFMTEKPMPPESALKATLTCRQFDGRRNNEDTKIETLWQETQILPASLNFSDEQFSLPIKFSLPDNLPQSGQLTETVEIEWELQFSSKAFGYSQHREFTIPVFAGREAFKASA